MTMKLSFVQRHAYGWGAGFAALLWPFFPSRRRIAIENLIKGKVAADITQARRIAKASWCHLAGHIAEALLVPGVIGGGNWREHLEVEGASPEAVKLLLETPDTPIIIASAHHGAWEAATNLLSFARPMIAIARAMNSRFVTKWLEKHHFRGRIKVIDKNRGFTPAVIRQWLDTNAAMTVLIDQHTKKGVRLSFFGRPAYTFTSATRLAMRYQVPIVVGTFVRVAPYRYRLVGGEPVLPAKDASLAAVTQLLNDRLEAAIRQYPEQYLWFHRRWRNG